MYGIHRYGCALINIFYAYRAYIDGSLEFVSNTLWSIQEQMWLVKNNLIKMAGSCEICKDIF